MNRQTKKLLSFAIIIVIIALIFFVVIKNKTKKTQGNIISPTEYHEITDKEIQEAKEKENQTNIAKVVIYWSLNDEKSLEILKLFNSFYSKYSDKINFLAVNNKDNATKIAVFFNNNNITIPTATTANLNLEEIKEEELETIPCYAFIQKDGNLLDFTSKELTKDSVEAYLDILAENY